MQIRKQISGLVGKVLLGASLTFGSTSIANAQQVYVVPGYDQKMMDQAMANLAVANMSGIVANGMNDPRAANLIRGLGQLNKDMAWINMHQATNRNTVIILNNNKQKNNNSQRDPIYNKSNTIIARGYNDLNNDGHIEWKEFDKLNDTIYSTTESFIIGGYVALKGIKENLKAFIYDPKGNLTAQADFKFNTTDFEFRTASANIDDLVTKGGSGTYVATFFYGDKFWEARSFQLIKPGDRVLGQGTYRTFVAKRWTDFNNDDRIDDNELVGIDSEKINKNESVMIGIKMDGKGITGRKYQIKIYNPNGETIFDDTKTFPQDNSVSHITYEAENLVKENGLGTYSAAFYLDDKFWNSRNFEITE